MPMIKAMDINRNTVAIIENAYDVSYEKQTNQFWNASFFLPLNDSKINKIRQLGFVEITDTDEEYIGLFRVMPIETNKNIEANRNKFDCVHVLSLLMDSVMFGYHEISPNTSTRAVLEYLLNQQKVKHWRLGTCDFTRYFQYSWENENGLIDAIWSVANPLDEEYIWTFDTTNYPFTLNLVRPSSAVTARVREGHNLRGFTVKSNPNELINRIYPLGQGEGVNQLNIKKVNPTGQYYVEDTQSVAKNGLIEYVWADRRFTDATSLYNSAKALLEKWKQPLVSWELDAVDLIKAIPKKPNQKIPKIDELRLDKLIQVDTNHFGTLNLRILKESKSDLYGNPHDLKITVGYVPSDLGTTQADNERKIQINQLYSQGATNILNYDKADNADPSYPVRFKIFIDDDVVKINTCELTFETSAFRAYSKAIEGGGAIVQATAGGGGIVKATGGGGSIVQATSGGGAIVKATSAGGYTAKSTASGGSSVQSSTSESGGGQTSSSNGAHSHRMFSAGGTTSGIDEYVYTNFRATGNSDWLSIKSLNQVDLWTDSSYGSHAHTVSSHTHKVSIDIPAHSHNFEVPNHSHDVTLPNHTHQVTLPDHTHQVDLPNHTHEITLPNHTHGIEYGIFESPNSAKSIIVKVDGNQVSGNQTSRERVNIIPYLSKNEDGTIRKGMHTIEMTPDMLTRIEAQITLRVFIKSQLGGEF